MTDHRQVLADPQDYRRGTRAVELRLQEVRVDLLQLMYAGDRIQVGA